MNTNDKNSQHFELILGGARSGKSRFALSRARQSGVTLFYLATATAGDKEMIERINRHQAERGEGWQLIEEPLQLSRALRDNDSAEHCIVIDCITLWISNCLHHQCWETEQTALLEALPKLRSNLFFVSNETGLGIIPLGEVTRQFVDASGFFNQRLAEMCHRVNLIVAGLSHSLKDVNSSLHNK